MYASFFLPKALFNLIGLYTKKEVNNNSQNVKKNSNSQT